MIERLRETFREEARDHMLALENSLLELSEHPGDEEQIGRAFRALHTIKGSGAMCGLDALAGFTHHVENAFSEVREGRRPVTPQLVRAALEALDHIERLVESEGEACAAVPGEGEAIIERLGAEAPEAPPARALPAAAGAVEAAPAAECWHIYFRPAADILLKGTNPLLLLRELSTLGESRVEAHLDALPALALVEPSRCYLGWDIWLKTAAPENAIRDVFIFVEDDAELLIERAPGLESKPLPAPADAGLEEVDGPAGGGQEQAGGKAGGGGPSDAPTAEAARNGRPAASSTLRVPAEKLDRLVNIVGELVTAQARLSRLASPESDPDLQFVAEEMERLTAELRDNSMSLRMVPLRGTFEKFRRLVHDLGAELGKEARLETEGGDTELDKTLIDRLNDPLIHLIRNSMDHGLEAAADRAAAGKQPCGCIRLSARYSGTNVLVSVSDDGAGLSRERIRSRAVERGLLPPEAAPEDRELFAMILDAGFSTAREVTGLSGRGVGLDVVRRCMEELRGSVEISSREGAGATFTLRLPLTLAIVDGLLVRVAGEHYVLPMVNLVECVEWTADGAGRSRGSHLVEVRGELVPFVRLREYLRIGGALPLREQIMVAEVPGGYFGFAVDEVLGNHQTVIKPLGRLCRHAQVFAGATILGDGTVALILDLHRLSENALRSHSSAARHGGRHAGAAELCADRQLVPG